MNELGRAGENWRVLRKSGKVRFLDLEKLPKPLGRHLDTSVTQKRPEHLLIIERQISFVVLRLRQLLIEFSSVGLLERGEVIGFAVRDDPVEIEDDGAELGHAGLCKKKTAA